MVNSIRWILVLSGLSLFVAITGSAGNAPAGNAPAGTPPNPGQAASAPPFIAYDTGLDKQSGCTPFLDAAVIPISHAGSNGANLEFTTVDFSGRNYWVNGSVNPNNVLSSFHVNCSPILSSPFNPDPTQYSGAFWLDGVFEQSPTTLYGLIHNEFYGGQFPQSGTALQASAGCPSGNMLNCTYASVNEAVSSSGAAFQMIGAGASSVVARPPYSFAASIPTQSAKGYFQNSNIYQAPDENYYMFMVDFGLNSSQTQCPARTSNLADPTSWRAWDGSGYTVNTSQGADCFGVNLQVAPFYFGYNTYFQAFIVVGTAISTPFHVSYALSADMIHWSAPVDLGIAPAWSPGASSATGWGNYSYPSLMDTIALRNTSDPNSASGAVTGKAPYLLYVDRKGDNTATRLVGVQLEFAQAGQPIPQVTSEGLGCTGPNCGWLKGSNFTSQCSIDLYSLDYTQHQSISNPSCSDTYATFLIPPTLQAAYSSLYVTVTNSFGNWSYPVVVSTQSAATASP